MKPKAKSAYRRYSRERRNEEQYDQLFFEWCKGGTIASIARLVELPSDIVFKKMSRINTPM